MGAALAYRRIGLADNWLRHIQDIRQKHAALLESVSEELRADRLCELNVIEQVVNVSQTTVVADAWERGQEVTIHGWTYAVRDGLVRAPHISIAGNDEIRPAYDGAVAKVGMTK